MRIFVFLSVFFWIFGMEQAFAADALSNAWTGFYGGLNAGYGLGVTKSQYDFTGTQGAVLVGTLNGRKNEISSDLIGGLQLGYNWQSQSYLFGLETDVQGNTQNKKSSSQPDFIGNPGVNTGAIDPSPISNKQKWGWFGTLRARLGYVLGNNLLYATGGLAYGNVKIKGSVSPENVTGCALGNFCNETSFWSFSDTKVGWTAGFGSETMIDRFWSIKFEYLYIDLGKISGSFNLAPGCQGTPIPGGCTVVTGGTSKVSADVTENVIRIGLNRRF